MATNTSNAVCRPYTEIPDFVNLPIPQNINVVATPGNDTSYPPMKACCEPNRVQIVDGCYLWCEMPKRYFNGTDKDSARSSFSSCLVFQQGNTTDRRITGYQLNAATRPGLGSAKQVGLWALALSGLIYVL